MKMTLFAGLVLAITLHDAPPYGAILSNFDVSAEGWTGVDWTGDWTAHQVNTGGNGGGYLQGVESESIGYTGYYVAPASWLGDWTQYIDGTLSWDFKVISGASSNYYFDKDVIISNGSTSISWTSPQSLYSTSWVNHQVILSAANFGGNANVFNQVMANVTKFQIRGEVISYGEVEGLDNVMLSGGSGAVPEPGTLLIWSGLGAIGMAVCAVRRRWRKQ